MMNATTTDIDYLKWHPALLRNPNPATNSELVTWVCHDNITRDLGCAYECKLR